MNNLDHAEKEIGGHTGSFITIGEVTRQDEECAVANGVRETTIDSCLVFRVVGNRTIVLLILGVAKQNSANDLILDFPLHLSESVTDNGGSLAVTRCWSDNLTGAGDGSFGAGGYAPIASCEDRCLGTLIVGHLEESLGFIDGLLICAFRKEVWR